MAEAMCPDCGQQVEAGVKPKMGQWLMCPHCNADLEVVSVNPLELDWASDVDDDDEDELWDEAEIWEDEEEEDLEEEED
jgi:alpha-aminoadipate/glutamate carrier protein LysW